MLSLLVKLYKAFHLLKSILIYINELSIYGMADITKFRSDKKGVETFLSPLESEVLDVLWEKKSARVRDIFLILKSERKVALTSIAVTLDRLYDKKIVEREVESGKGGLHYIYSVKNTKKDFEKSMIDKIVNELINNFGDTAVTYFNEKFSGKK